MRPMSLRDDEVTVFRRTAETDAEGNDLGTSAVTWSGKGHLGSLSARDVQVAGAAASDSDAVLAVKLPSADAIAVGDEVLVRSKRWVVRFVEDVRKHFRVYLGEVT